MSDNVTLVASLIKAATTLRDTRYVTVACLVTLLWDTFITISDEIDLIWVRIPRIGLIPTVYLANKYISIAALIVGVYHVSDLRGPITVDLSVPHSIPPNVFSLTHWHNLLAVIDIYHPQSVSNFSRKSCRNVSSPPSPEAYVFAVVNTLLTDPTGILTLRVVALYHGETWVKRASWGLFVTSYILCATVTVFAIKYNFEHVKIAIVGDVCSVTGAPKIFAIIFIFPLIYEFFMTFLTFKKAIGHAHALRDRSTAPLLHVLYIEKILYFVAITATRTALVYILVTSQNVYLGLALLWAIDVVLVSRFYLEMMTVGRKGYVPTSIWTSEVITGRDHPEISIFAPQDVSQQESRLERGS